MHEFLLIEISWTKKNKPFCFYSSYKKKVKKKKKKNFNEWSNDLHKNCYAY